MLLVNFNQILFLITYIFNSFNQNIHYFMNLLLGTNIFILRFLLSKTINRFVRCVHLPEILRKIIFIYFTVICGKACLLSRSKKRTFNLFLIIIISSTFSSSYSSSSIFIMIVIITSAATTTTVTTNSMRFRVF